MLKKVYYNKNLEEITEKLGKRQEETKQEINDVVIKILNEVKKDKNKAIMKYAKELDGFNINDPKDFLVTEKEIEEAVETVGENFIRILNRTKEQITIFHKNQIEKSWSIKKEDGVIMGQIVRGLERVALYVPGGTATYPSTVMMNAIPAKLAGVKELIMLTPVKENGKVTPVILAAAKICGIDKIYKIGGVQAIGAVAYGTETIKKVDKIVGPRKYLCCYS